MREIESKDWQAFCRQVTRYCKGGLISIELIGANGLKTELVRDLLLKDILLHAPNPCNDVISVRARGGREVLHEVIDPIHVLLWETVGGNDFNPIQIDGENGTTLLTLHPAVHAQMLEGMKSA